MIPPLPAVSMAWTTSSTLRPCSFAPANRRSCSSERCSLPPASAAAPAFLPPSKPGVHRGSTSASRNPGPPRGRAPPPPDPGPAPRRAAQPLRRRRVDLRLGLLLQALGLLHQGGGL